MDPFGKEKTLSLIKIILVIFVLAIAGFFAVKLFIGPSRNISDINLVKTSFNEEFSKNQSAKILFFLDGNEATVKRGEIFNIAFAIKNSGEEGTFAYNLAPQEGDCANPEKLVIMGMSGSAILSENNTFYGIIRVAPQKSDSKCSEVFKLGVEKNNEIFAETLIKINLS